MKDLLESEVVLTASAIQTIHNRFKPTDKDAAPAEKKAKKAATAQKAPAKKEAKPAKAEAPAKKKPAAKPRKES